jgi:hypothetical protein
MTVRPTTIASPVVILVLAGCASDGAPPPPDTPVEPSVRETRAATPAPVRGFELHADEGPGEDAVDHAFDDDPPALTPDERRRYARVAVELVRAINEEDRAAYRALFTDAGWSAAFTWWRDMFALQTATYGRIARAYAPRRGLISFGGMAFRGDEGGGATFIVHFEEPNGAALSFALDGSGRIDHTSVFVKQELFGLDPGPTEIIYQLQ